MPAASAHRTAAQNNPIRRPLHAGVGKVPDSANEQRNRHAFNRIEITADLRGIGSDSGSRITSLAKPRMVLVQRAAQCLTEPGNGGIAGEHHYRPATNLAHRPRLARESHSVAIELDQAFIADPEVMRDLVEHDMPDLSA